MRKPLDGRCWLAIALACLSPPAESKCANYRPPELLLAVTRCNPVRYLGTEVQVTERGALMEVRVLAVSKPPMLNGKAEAAPERWRPGTSARIFISGSGQKICALTTGRQAPIMARPSWACRDTVPHKEHGPATHERFAPADNALYYEPPGEEELAERARIEARSKVLRRIRLVGQWRDRQCKR